MANERNVAALVEALNIINERSGDAPEALSQPVVRRLAEEMVQRYGVLVPSSLTVRDVGLLFDVPEGEAFRAARVEGLARIAKGQT